MFFNLVAILKDKKTSGKQNTTLAREYGLAKRKEKGIKGSSMKIKMEEKYLIVHLINIMLYKNILCLK